MCTRYDVLLSKVAGRDLKRLRKILDPERFQRLDEKLQNLADDPRPPGCEDLKGEENAYRVRDGDYRIVYAVNDASLEVKVSRVRDRKDVYRH